MTELSATNSIETSISREDYAAFIRQIELASIWLKDLKVTNHNGPTTPEQGSLGFQHSANWELSPGGFRSFCTYLVRLESSDALYLGMDVTFGLDFVSKKEMNDDVFSLFQDVNLPVNTWPYLREIVANVMGRLGWASFTLPTFKVGTVPSTRPNPSGVEKKTTRSRQKKSVSS